MSLVNCIKKAGKLISKKDSEALLARREQLIAKGVDEAEADLMAVRETERGIQAEIDDVLQQAGIKPVEKTGITVEIDGRAVDSEQFIGDVDNQLSGIDDIATCLTS